VATTQYPDHVARIVEEGLLSVEQDPMNRGTAGREASKFRSAIFALVNFIARRGSQTVLGPIAEGLVGNLRGFIEDQGWPTPDRDQDLELRGYGYETIGLLAKAAPGKILLEPSLNLLEWLFRSLREDASGKDVAVSIEEALSSVLGAFSKPFEQNIGSKFRQILLRYARSDASSGPSGKFARSTRYVATRFANRCLPYDDVLARWIDILAISGDSGERHEVVEEGKKGLDPYWFVMQNAVPGSEEGMLDKLTFPDFDGLVQFIFLQSMDQYDEMDLDGEDVVVTAERFHKVNPTAVPVVIDFCTQVGMHAALAQRNIRHELSDDWGRRLESLMATDQRPRQAFRAYTALPQHRRSVALLLRAGFDLLIRDEVANIGDVGNAFVRLCALSAESSWLQARLVQDFRALEPSILANNPVRRLTAAHSYGMLASRIDCDPVQLQKSHQLFFDKITAWSSAVGAGLNQISGIVVALGYYFSRLHWRTKGAAATDRAFHQLLEVIIIGEILVDTKDATLKAAVISCIDQLALYYVITPNFSFRGLAQYIYDSAKSGNVSAILALGHLAMITDESEVAAPDSSEITDYAFISGKLYELHEVRQPEAQFSIGEALSCFAVGWDSRALTAQLDIEHPDQQHDSWDAPVLTPSGPKRRVTLEKVLEMTLEGCRQTKPSLKRASVIWLLCLIQYCGHRPEFQGYLRQCQNAFKVCLSNRDEIVQEAASRGLGLVYEKGDRGLKDDLVRDLVGSFSDNKSKMSGSVEEDTQLFEPGALPTGDGKSITTYKDILSLASEVGDSSLVYRFMSLASNNSIWSSRAAFGRFGLSNIFSDSSVDGYLAENPKLYPKLFRYR
jgi:proteasome component ECM29